MAANGLARSIDRLGELRGRLHAMRFEERALVDQVREAMQKAGMRRAEGGKYRAELVEQTRLEVDVKKLRRLAGDRFVDCVRADLRAAKDIFGREAVEKIAKAETVTQVRVTEKDTRPRMPRRPQKPEG